MIIQLVKGINLLMNSYPVHQIKKTLHNKSITEELLIKH